MIIYRDYEAVKSHLYKAAIALKKRHNYCEVEELVNAIYLAGGVLTVENPKYIQIDLLNYLLLSVELTEEEDLIITAVFYRETKLNKIAKDMRMSIEQVEIHIEEALAKFRQLIGELDL